jgi:hypothetical protein
MAGNSSGKPSTASNKPSAAATRKASAIQAARQMIEFETTEEARATLDEMNLLGDKEEITDSNIIFIIKKIAVQIISVDNSSKEARALGALAKIWEEDARRAADGKVEEIAKAIGERLSESIGAAVEERLEEVLRKTEESLAQVSNKGKEALTAMEGAREKLV